jgi:hypothetical protein
LLSFSPLPPLVLQDPAHGMQRWWNIMHKQLIMHSNYVLSKTKIR